METFLHKIATAITAIGLGASSFLPIQHKTDLGSTLPTPVAQFQTSLASSIGANDTSMSLVSGTDKAGTTLASSTYGFIIDEGTGSDEFVLANCTNTSCTGMTRGISVVSGTTSVASLKKAHRRGASVKITDAPLLLILTRIANGQDGFPNKLKYDSQPTLTSDTDIPYKGYVDTAGASSTSYANGAFVKLAGSQTITSTNTWSNTQTFSTSPVVPTPSNATDAANKAYIDGVAIAGGVTASNVVTGIQRVATSTQIASGYASSTAYAIPSSLASSTASSTASIVVATKTSTGKIDPSFLNGSTESYTFNGTTTLATTTITNLTVGGYPLYGAFGDASDGDATIGAGTTTLSSDKYYNNLTLTGVLVTAGYKVYVAGTVSGSGVLTWGIPNNGSDGGVGGGGSGGGGSGGASSGSGPLANQAGSNGGAGNTASCSNGTNVSALTNSVGVKGGVGGTGSCSGGTVGNTSYIQKPGILAFNTIPFMDIGAAGTTTYYQASSGGSGGGGGNAGSSGWNNGGGGGGGASCGNIYLAAKVWGGSFTIRCIGGTGGIGGATNNTSQTTYAGGGGGGGGGGVAYTIYGTKSWSGSYQLTGGTGGLGGATGGAGRANSGANGTAGASYEYDIRQLLR